MKKIIFVLLSILFLILTQSAKIYIPNAGFLYINIVYIFLLTIGLGLWQSILFSFIYFAVMQYLTLRAGGSINISSFLVAAFVASVMYIIQEAQLKKKKFGFIFQRFPALDTIGKINNTSLTIGFYFFTIGAVLGFIWMLQNNLEEILSSAKVVFSVLTWILYAALIALRRIKPLTQRQTAQWTIIGFILIIVTYVGVASFMLR